MGGKCGGDEPQYNYTVDKKLPTGKKGTDNVSGTPGTAEEQVDAKDPV